MLLFIRTLAEKQIILILLDFYAVLVSQHWEQRSIFKSSSISSRRRWLSIRSAMFQLSSDDKVFSALGTAVFPPIFLLLLNLFNMAPEIEFASSNFPPSHKTASYAGYQYRKLQWCKISRILCIRSWIRSVVCFPVFRSKSRAALDFAKHVYVPQPVHVLLFVFYLLLYAYVMSWSHPCSPFCVGLDQVCGICGFLLIFKTSSP